MGSMAGKDAQMLGVTLPPRSSPFLYTRALEWLEQQQSEGVAGGTGIEVQPHCAALWGKEWSPPWSRAPRDPELLLCLQGEPVPGIMGAVLALP